MPAPSPDHHCSFVIGWGVVSFSLLPNLPDTHWLLGRRFLMLLGNTRQTTNLGVRSSNSLRARQFNQRLSGKLARSSTLGVTLRVTADEKSRAACWGRPRSIAGAGAEGLRRYLWG